MKSINEIQSMPATESRFGYLTALKEVLKLMKYLEESEDVSFIWKKLKSKIEG